MVTFAQAQERAEEWVNGEVPSYQHREVRVREFGLGFVVWAEDREDGPRSDGGGQRLVIARDSGEATLWPALAVGEVIRRYEEEYARTDETDGPAPAAPARVDLNQTSFLLSPPEWLQEAADRRGETSGGSAGTAGSGAAAGTAAPGAPVAPGSGAAAPAAADRLGIPDRRGETSGGSAGTAGSGAAAGTAAPGAPGAPVAPGSGAAWPAAGGGDSPAGAGAGTPAGATPWAGTDTNADAGEDGSVPLPVTVFAPPLSQSDDGTLPPPASASDAPTALMSGGSRLPPTALTPALQDADAQTPPDAGTAAPGAPAQNAADIADAATRGAAPPRRPTGPPPPPPGAPGMPGVRPGGTPPPSPPSGAGAPGGPAGGYVPTQMVSSSGSHGLGGFDGRGGPAGPGGPQPSGASTPAPGAPGTPPGGVHHAATMFADPGRPGAGTPPPPGPPGAPGAPVHHAETVLAGPPVGGPGTPPPPSVPGGPGVPPPPAPPGMPGAVPPGVSGPGRPPAYGYPSQPVGQPTVGPGYQAVLRYRAQDGSEQQLIRRSAPGTPHPEWQVFHELRAMNVPPGQVLELHTELESCELPGAYCARMIREQWPQARITNIAPYGTDHASRQQGMQQLLVHQGELHQVADGPARPAPVRAPLPPVQPAPPLPPEAIGQELAGAFGPGVFRFEQQAVSRQGVPPVVAHTLVAAGLPLDMGPFFWAQAQPGRPVPTLAELAAERGVQPASDAGSYLVVGSDFGKAICVQYGTANIVAVPVEAGPGGAPVPPQFVNTGLPEFARCLALLGRMWRLRFGLNQEQAGRWTVDFQTQLAALDPAALGSPESWWSVLLEQMWDGLL
ncbi:SUKH-4 family immunity protein [Streptomyces sp. KMM 9044]|uniref:SUKH-4 family immunity protein n=1 Tax=Streptomyces sp. KMM 9044 TaxID=2744474 RepID=UPI0022B23603|nr:SUKH-4 family immunity protein [Streptomyces sp. KMM 9044]WAX79642.1 SUKH-4 family immunity protein [Streptomyces sp. KMM 9044]